MVLQKRSKITPGLLHSATWIILDDELLIFKEGILDSMGLISLFSFLEQEFNIQITDADLVEENFESVKAITNFVTERQN